MVATRKKAASRAGGPKQAATRKTSAQALTPLPFRLPIYSDKELSDPKFSRLQINDLAVKIRQRDIGLAERDGQLVALNGQAAQQQIQIDAAKVELTRRDGTIAAANRQIAELLAAKADLAGQLERINVNRPKIAVDDLVRQFSGSVERLNADARKAGGTAFLVDNLRVEIKAGIDVSNGVRLSQLPESAIGVESVSTLSFALKPNTVIRIVDDEAKPG